MSLRAVALRALAACAFLSFVGASCGQTALGLLPGVINDPHNLSLRKAILGYGTSRMCAEVLKRSMPLRLRAEDPVMGRMFPSSCTARDLAGGDLYVQFGGKGYIWNNLALRVGFAAQGGVTYDTDFQLDGSTMYVYFRQRATAGVQFTTTLVEQPQASVLANMPVGPGGLSVADTFGSQIMSGEIARGFTVIREANGNTEFGPGIIPVGRHPAAPFHSGDSGRDIVANERSEVHQNQRDFVGPIDVPKGKKLFLTVGVDGAPAADVLLLPRGMGEMWLQTYISQAQTTPPPMQPYVDEPVFSGAIWRKTLQLPPGQYYLVLDNTPTAGRTMPTTYAHDDRAALVSYAIELD